MGFVLALIPALFMADQLVKWFVLERIFAPRLLGENGLNFWAWFGAEKLPLTPGISIEYLPFFNLSMAWNKGVSFSLLSSDHAGMAYGLAAFSVLVCCAFLFWAYKSHSALERAGVGLIVAGALGNAFDRLRFGAVADFFDFYIAGRHFPAFNVADTAITVGVCLILFYAFVLNQKKG